MRKVVGSVRQDLIQQFLTESMIVSLLAFLLGLLLAALLMPSFNTLVAKSLSIPYVDWHALAIFLFAIFGVGLVAGLYPSFFLSHFKPIEVMKGSLSKGSKGANLRGALVVFQFTISIVLIVGTLVISQQMNFVLNQKIGFVKDQVLILQGTGTLDKQIESFKNELKDLSSVQSVTVSDYLPVKGTKRNGNTFRNKDTQKEERGIFGQNWVVDVDYVKTMGMQLVAGRNFDERIASDSAGAIINQAMA
ncbi:MAG: FtsX-like permease family protein, partial [Flammeovirgaceae bacterium]